MGNFAKRDRYFSGRGYRARWRRYEEKQTDVGIGVHLINDAHKNLFDRALVIGVDTDLLPAFKMMKEEFPNKSVACVHRRVGRIIENYNALRRLVKS